MHPGALIWCETTHIDRCIAIAHPIIPAVVPNAFVAAGIGYTTINTPMWRRIADRIAIVRAIIIPGTIEPTAISMISVVIGQAMHTFPMVETWMEQ